MSTATKMSTSIYIEPSEAKTIKRAAKKQGKTISVFMREAAMKEAAKLHDACPTCGRKHAA